MVGDGRITIVPPCWTNLGKEHSVLWFVTLDCRNEPERAELDFGSKERKKGIRGKNKVWSKLRFSSRNRHIQTGSTLSLYKY